MKTLVKIRYELLSAILCICSFLSCSGQKSDLKMEILNSEIVSRSDIHPKHRSNLLHYDNYIYDSLPVNKINIKIFNSGKNVYVLFLKKDLNETENTPIENFKMKVFKGESLLVPKMMDILVQATMKGFLARKSVNVKDSDSLTMELNEKYLKEKIDFEKIEFQREMNYVIIHPGESKFFNYYKTLPIFMEAFYTYYKYDFSPTENYSFQMTLANDSKKLRKYLTVNQLKEIEANKYILFDGIIASNKVPVKLVPISQKQ